MYNKSCIYWKCTPVDVGSLNIYSLKSVKNELFTKSKLYLYNWYNYTKHRT